MATALVIVSGMAIVGAAAILLLAQVRRQTRWGEPRYPGGWSELDDGDDETGVREPRRPLPSSGTAAASVELDD